MGSVIGFVLWILMFTVMGVVGTGWMMVGAVMLPAPDHPLYQFFHICWMVACMCVVMSVMCGFMTFADKTYNYRWYKRRAR